MKKYIFFIVVLVLLMCSCFKHKVLAPQKILLFGDSISIIGVPDSSILTKFINSDEDYTYIFNNMVSMSLILEPPAIYHCFILEHVGSDKQLYYLKIDDAMKYNWIPPYDSINYDLGLDFIKTEMAGCSIKSNYDGLSMHFKPDTAMKWSSKYEQIPSLRMNSEKYNEIVSQCNDAIELSDYYNHSLFFQNNDFVREEDKTCLLDLLLRTTQIQFVDYFFDFEVVKNGIDIYPIYLGWIAGPLSYSTYKVPSFSTFDTTLKKCCDHLNFYEQTYISDHSSKDNRRTISRYLLDMNSSNLNYIVNNLKEIENLYNKSSMMFFSHRPHEDFRIFFFNITYDENNKITIEKNYYNKEYITTTRIRGYL